MTQLAQYIAPRATAPRASLRRAHPALAEALRAVVALARKFDAWLAQRRRTAEDRATLAGMSDRDLLDIGISRASIEGAADGTWRRDVPY